MNTYSPVNDQVDDTELFKILIQKPRISWPTVTLLIAAFITFSVSTFAYLQGELPLDWAMLINSIASYMAFPAAHDATHGAVFKSRKINDWAGRAAMTLLEPGPFFQVFRFIHMKHHRFTNHSEKDPDIYSGTGPAWLLPFKWLTLDVIYFKTYLSRNTFKKRPKSERREFYVSVLFAITVIVTVTALGWLHYYLLLFFIPTRIAKFIIVIAFDFLPHFPHEAEELYRCTSNRMGMEWLLTPIFIYQNYHLVHHLYPTIPFYRYLKVWNSRKHYHEAQNPAIVDTFSLMPR